MICIQCNSEISEESTFCPFCGSRQTPGLQSDTKDQQDSHLLNSKTEQHNVSQTPFMSSRLLFAVGALVVVAVILLLTAGRHKSEMIKFLQKRQILSDSIALNTSRAEILYSTIDSNADDDPIQGTKLRNSAYEFKTRTDELYFYVEDLKNEILRQTEKKISKTPDGTKVKRIGNKKIPYTILIGSDLNGKVFELEAILNDYLIYVTKIVPYLGFTGMEILNLKGVDISTVDNSPAIQSWADLNLKNKPIGVVLNNLLLLQLEVKRLEVEVLGYLSGQASYY